MYKKLLYLLPIALLVPALLINLGQQAFIDDEGIRALVAYEMMLSDNYITPTLHGDFYYKKPPLFNWIILMFYEISGQIGEYMPRLITVIMLLLYSGTVWYFYRKHFGKKMSFLVVFSLITCGRILFWDSFLGLIDISFSWVIFTMFMVIYHRFQEGKLWRLFIEVYLLTAIAFLLKGFPAIVFVGVTLLTVFIYKKAFRKLFMPAHFLGCFVFLLIVGAYYAIYHQYNSLENVFPVLFNESSQRTVINYGLWRSVKHFFTFPFEMTYHFLPWSLLIVLALIPKYFKQLLKHDFLFFNIICFLANVFVYWISPQVFPRYLLMFSPLVFAPCLYLYFQHQKDNTIWYRSIDVLFGVICSILLAASFIPHFLERTLIIQQVHIKAIFITAMMLPLLWFYFKNKESRLLIVVSFILLLRVGFDWFVIPDRVGEDPKSVLRAEGLRIGEKYNDKDIFLYKDLHIAEMLSFYLTKGAKKIIPRKSEDFDSTDLYILHKNNLSERKFIQVDSLNDRDNNWPLRLVRIEE